MYRNDYVELLSQEGTYVAKIEHRDVNKVLTRYWSVDEKGYVRTQFPNRTALHNFIMDLNKPSKDREVDHINRDRTDNRRINLRFVNRQLNNLNITKQKNNTSGHTGVAWHKQRGKWRAYIMIDYKQHSLGLFESKTEAIKARKKALKSVFNDLYKKYSGAK